FRPRRTLTQRKNGRGVGASMAVLYSAEDVARWESVSTRTVGVQLAKLSDPGVSASDRRFRLSALSGAYYSLALTEIAKHSFERAREYLRGFVQRLCEVYDVTRSGGDSPQAGHFQSVLVSLLTKDETLTSRLIDRYRWEVGTQDSMFHGKLIKLLLTSAASHVVVGGEKLGAVRTLDGLAENLSVAVG